MYNKINKLNEVQFRRKTGVKRKTFNKMVGVISKAENERKKILGRPLKLSYEDQTLMTLEYMREYRTYFSLGQVYDISEANCYKTCKKVEDILIKSKDFRLPNRKDVYENPNIEIVVVDAVESSIERPKKSKEYTILERNRSIR